MNRTPVHGPALDAWLAAAARVAPITWTPGDLGADDGPDEEVLSGGDCDQRAGIEQDRQERQWRWFE